MKKVWIVVIVLLLIPAQAHAIDTHARSAILMEQDSKRILYSKNVHEARTVASISKIMTGILAVESKKLGDMIQIGDEIDKAYGSAVYIKKGEKLTLEDLVYGLMLRSGNDAALAIANHVGGSTEAFVKMMNDKAAELGMKDTTFHNPHGLDEGDLIGNISSAYDMAVLTSYAMQNQKYRKIVGTKKYKLSTNKNTYIWHNKNKLLTSYKYTTGGKTGFTKKAKRTLVSSALKSNLNLISVTLDDGADFQDHKNLFEYGFSTYKNYKIVSKGIINVYDDTYYKDYNLYVKKDLTYPLLDTEKDHIVLKIELEKKRKHKRDSQVGKVTVTLGDKKLGEEKIYIKDLKKYQSGFFGQLRSFLTNG
ncbi:MAG: D-alanyl-D-alanine carboxypeptidase [Bacilli bacterium]|nr:D-alanyl-D-alanine carboxypeptidase [Bacilli bacterium]